MNKCFLIFFKSKFDQILQIFELFSSSSFGSVSIVIFYHFQIGSSCFIVSCHCNAVVFYYANYFLAAGFILIQYLYYKVDFLRNYYKLVNNGFSVSFFVSSLQTCLCKVRYITWRVKIHQRTQTKFRWILSNKIKININQEINWNRLLGMLINIILNWLKAEFKFILNIEPQSKFEIKKIVFLELNKLFDRNVFNF